ncbi:hypothetical protein HHK36_020267 [Tetracentron sinense]|uniref:Rab-GAP TBC domain-containing protein n=1 Tax=Tetracentron sinense TaxID=13715 RepID=A0A834YRD7_TETSI|nr:hypothetical protein HHK36_020267 [Tetracentron sinense]
MVTKSVPEWMNSSLWSSSPSPDDDRFLKYASNSSTTTIVPPVETTIPESPPKIVEEESSEPEARDSNSDDERSSSIFSSEDVSRQAQFLAELSKKVINMRELRRLASQGIPEGAGIRPTVWKLLLGYLPSDGELWSSELAKKRSQYKHFKEELLVNPSDITMRLDKSTCLEKDKSKCEGSGLLSRSEITHGEHPLSLGKTSIWNQFFQDTEIIEQIDRDVKRTHPDMPFFSEDSSFAKSNQEALRNILIVFAKLNPGIKYVQGMNEVLAPLFYVFRNDPDEENARLRTFKDCRPMIQIRFCFQLCVPELLGQLDIVDPSTVLIGKSMSYTAKMEDKSSFDYDPEMLCHGRHPSCLMPVHLEECPLTMRASAEADTFFCFVELLSGFRDYFCQQLDNSVVGIRSTITKLSQLLKEHDEELWRHLEVTTKVNPQFYAFRWITLLLTQEFNFTDSLRIWDTLLSDPEGPQDTLLRICCAMLFLVRRRLLAGDFTSNLKLLQNYPSTNTSQLLYVADKLSVRAAN